MNRSQTLLASAALAAGLAAGLAYEFNPKGLVNHPNFMKWMGEAVRHEFEQSATAPAKRS